jgi:hypothetical protein
MELFCNFTGVKSWELTLGILVSFIIIVNNHTKDLNKRIEVCPMILDTGLPKGKKGKF